MFWVFDLAAFVGAKHVCFPFFTADKTTAIDNASENNKYNLSLLLAG